MQISIVIPTFNRRDLLEQALHAASNQTYSTYDIIVVDDGSTDGSQAMVRNRFPEIQLIEMGRNSGPAAARNAGIQASIAEVILFTDDDCIIPNHFVAAIADGYARFPEVAGVGGYQEPPESILATHLLARYESYKTRTVYQVGEQEQLGGFDCPAGGTNSMSYRKSILESVDLFDTTFPVAAGEDAHLKFKITELGHQLLFLPLKVDHYQPYRWGSFWGQQIRRGIGEVYFQSKIGRGVPTYGRILARLGKRSLAFFRNLFKMGLPLAGVELLAGWAACVGQVQAVYMLRSDAHS